MLATVAEDDRTTATMLTRALETWGFEVRVAHDGLAAWDLLNASAPPALAIVDWMMPGLDGLELCRRIRTSETLHGLYVLLLTARDQRADVVNGLDAGANDYMVKPFHFDELRARVNAGLRVAGLQNRLAERMTELQTSRDHLARLVSTDALTEVYSRRWWFQLAETEFSRSRRYHRALSVLMIDLDHFKQVNDTFGHATGDTLLQLFARMLRRECRRSDVIGRVGGEEFAVLVPEGSLEAAQHLAARINLESRRLAVPGAPDLQCSCSIGISEVREDDGGIDAALRRADAAMYAAKRSGRNCVRASAPQPPAESNRE